MPSQAQHQSSDSPSQIERPSDDSTGYPQKSSIGFDDPRSSSTQSLRPVESAHTRRKLLLVYIHGFLGAEASFQQFPSHVHSLLTIYLAGTHVVHTKIYPRYQSRRNITIAREAFSKWLVPHESDMTDVVILGHSLGGILAAEIVLIPADSIENPNVFRHRLLGLVAFDTPFLGIHPGVIPTGIASLFKPSPDEWSGNTGDKPPELYNTSLADPNYNPVYTNDVQLPVRNTMWDRAQYFWNKHTGHLVQATKAYVMSYFEFGGCLADYTGLRRRYESVRALEDVDDLKNIKGPHGKLLRRVRFVNYYSACTGKPKKRKTSPTPASTNEQERAESHPNDEGHSTLSNQTVASQSSGQVPIQYDDFTVQMNSLAVTRSYHSPGSVALGSSDKTLKSHPTSFVDQSSIHPQHDDIVSSVDAQPFSSKESAPKETAVSHQENPASQQRLSSPTVGSSMQSMEEENKDGGRSSGLNSNNDSGSDSAASHSKRRKERKFCTLATTHGRVDSTWEKIQMDSADEVVAHTSMFFVSDAYSRLVGDTAERITQWVNEAATTRILMAGRDSHSV